ncbi:hypothetical protein [Paenibacillus xylanexedens]|uniref:hypothetical protein n=1 Tax=Paenibacillus xylanexedens TaxID=528191 RepID=UPI00119C988E|nr:hypothetical protein [Paenibacillus xylanexedens]
MTTITESNMKATVKGNKLIIEIDLTKDQGLSQSGKSINVLSTKMFENITGTNLSIKANIIRKPNTDRLGNPILTEAAAVEQLQLES